MLSHFINPIDWVAGFPPEWAVFFLSMLPITELRASIPIGISVYHLPLFKNALIAIAGNMFPTVILLYIMPKVHVWVMKQKVLGHMLNKKLKEAEKKFSGKYAKYGAVALVIFVGIPLPFTGAWTGSLAAFVFNIPFKRAVPLILTGVCLAATIMTLITISANGVFSLF
ncbi:small multi-drug export protein [Patescibacteria group bacterium]|nr:small multi-drug export protein [Patescibacteria group bacterium]MBU1721633.1 small multi-drug export protein [Patescibacteria group bacterium]MBU1901705.1 small multi-drug export protein [Patescibacteria group bacterium]